MDKYDYPYVGKLYFNASNKKYYYYSLTGLKRLVMDTITYFENLIDDSDTDIEISYQSASDERGVVIWSKKFNRFVFSTYEEGNTVYYDNWSTRDHYMSGQFVKFMHFYLNGTDGKLYFTDPERKLTKVTDDFLKAESNQVSKFIPITDINNAFDVNTVFNGNPLLVKDFHWKYYVTADRSVVGILEVTVGQNDSGIEITERFTTSWALSNKTFRPAGEEHNIYTRHCYSYRDDSREIRPSVWTTWYKYSERFTTPEKTKLTELPTNNELKSTLDKKVEVYDIDFSSDPYNFTNSNWKNANTLPAFITELQEYLNTNYSVFTSQIIEAIEQNRILRLVNHNTDGNINYALPVDLNYPDGNKSSITFVYECVFNSPTKHTRICKLCIPLNDSKGKVTYEILPSDYAINEQREIALCHKVNRSETLDVTPYWGKYLVVTYPAEDSSMSTIQIAFSSKLSDGEMWVRLKGVPTVSVDGAVVTKGIDFVPGKEKILHVTKSGETFEFETLDGVNDEISYNPSGYRVDLYGGSREYITVTDHALELRLNTLAIDLKNPNKTMTAMAYLNIITDTPNITIGNPLITTKYQEDFKLEKGYYELNCLFNGKEWVVAAMKIGEE